MDLGNFHSPGSSAIPSATTIATTMACATLPFVVAALEESSSPHLFAPSLQRNQLRALHAMPYEHTHVVPQPTQQVLPIVFVPDPGTEAPTWDFEDDEYYTDDGRITGTMVDQKKELFEKTHKHDHETTTTTTAMTTTTNEILQEDQGLQSSAERIVLRSGWQTVYAGILVGAFYLCC